ncbi:hypothetical protein [Verrucomicrobium sp. BvORR106]|uniref:hypothetical protein n=1 Tax=Verrucomicrobium sp. BvORR106 TaxID=1403819 RepID=UPI0022410186|nr:hypothetical protein [Verrucomicrobium sp. BvORR106]
MSTTSTPSIHTTPQVLLRMGRVCLHAAGIILVGLALVGYCVLSYPTKRCAFSEQLRSDFTTSISHPR